jgi:hypothetical protein
MKLLATLLIAGVALLAQRAGGGARMAPRPAGGNAGFHRVTAPPIRIVPPVRTIIAPYPAFYGGSYYGPYTGYDTAPPSSTYGYGYNDPNYGDPNTPQNYAYDPSQSGQPQVLINRNYAPDSINPVIHNYSGEPLQDPQAQGNPGINDTPQVVFLIAMKDHTIFPAVAYWVEDGTLNYITTQGVHNSASLDLIDRDFSKLLNNQRQIDFALPAPK